MSETGTLARAIEQTTRLLDKRPDLAEEQANEILKVIPGQPHALMLLAQARRAQGNDSGARDVLAPVRHHIGQSPVVIHRTPTNAAAIDSPQPPVTAMPTATPRSPRIARTVATAHAVIAASSVHQA